MATWRAAGGESEAISRLRPLPLAEEPSNPGELVAVVGYPMGVLGMVAKSPPAVYDRLAFRRDDIGAPMSWRRFR